MLKHLEKIRRARGITQNGTVSCVRPAAPIAPLFKLLENTGVCHDFLQNYDDCFYGSLSDRDT